MTHISNALTLAIAFFLALFAVGCGGSRKTTFDPTGKYKMEEIGQMLAFVKANEQALPRSVNELEAIEPVVPLSAADLRSGDIVYFWGVGLSSDSKAANTIVAHEKNAANNGGWVLMQDGSVKQMTAEEFKAAPIAK